jgi:hypothetical protein
MGISFLRTYAKAGPDATLSRSVNTLVIAPDFDVPIVPNESMSLRYVLLWNSQAATTGIALALAGPASPALVRYITRIWTSLTAVPSLKINTAFGSELLVSAGILTPALLLAEIDATVVNGPNEGSVSLQWRSEVNGSNVFLQPGSGVVASTSVHP